MSNYVTVGGNLFRIAAEQLNDATQWIRIAQLNSLRDPNIQGIVTLKLPEMDPSAGGGIASQ